MSFFQELKDRNVIRVVIAYAAVAWLIIQVAETLFPVFELSDALLRAIVILLVIGFVPTVIIAWVYELTPQGFVPEKDLDADHPRGATANRNFDRAIIVVLALALGYFAVDKFLLDPLRDTEREQVVAREARTEALQDAFAESSITVLPFANPGGDASEAYFSDGIAEELITLLGRVPRLRVISRSSAFQFRDDNVAVQDVGMRLGVEHVLEGSVKRTAGSIAISVRLVEAASNRTLWAQDYEAPPEGVFTMQEDIAAAVVDTLRITVLDGPPQLEETDPDAYSLYLQARHLAHQFGEDTFASAAELYEQALAVDPDFSRAWAGLGWVYANQASSGLRPADEALELARDATWTALAIDPRNARAYANVGWLALVYDNDLVKAAQHYSRAIVLDPNDVGILNGAAVLTELLGRADEAVRLHKYSVARDPMDATRHANLAIAYLSAGRPDESIASMRAAMALSEERIGAFHLLGTALLVKGDADAALEAFEQEVDDEYRVKGRALAYHSLGRAADFDAALTELRETWGDEWPSEVAQVYAWSGDADNAFDWLNRAVIKGETGLMEQALLPHYVALHDDPRWRTFLEAGGRSPEQLASISFDVPPLPN